MAQAARFTVINYGRFLKKFLLIIEIIDESHKLEPFLEKINPYFEKAGKGYIITLDETTVLSIRPEAGNE